jgi:hypothetical protein
MTLMRMVWRGNGSGFLYDAEPDPDPAPSQGVLRICNHWSTVPPRPLGESLRLHCEPSRLHCEPSRLQVEPPCLSVSPPQLPAFGFDKNPWSGFLLWCGSADKTYQNDEDPCGFRSAILLLIMFFVAVFIWFVQMVSLPSDTRWASTEMWAAGRIYDSAWSASKFTF